LEENLLPDLLTSLKLSKIFYKQKKLRNFLLKPFGGKVSDMMTDVFMGDRSYPKDLNASIRRNLRKAIFGRL
jgi:hypothetical protein